MIPRLLFRPLLSAVVFANAKAKRLAIRLTRWTGKSREYVHPKHLLGESIEQYWYLAHFRAEAAVLDVGCGNGMHSLKAAARSRWVVGLDRDRASLGMAIRTARARQLCKTAFVAADMEHGLPIASGPFDTVTSSSATACSARSGGSSLPELTEELGRNAFRIDALHPTVYDTPFIGVIDLVGSLSLTLYRKLTEVRRRLARRCPEENAGFYAVCTVK